MQPRGERPRPAELIPVGAGLGLIALSGYAALALAGHVLTPASYAAVASLYLLVSVLGPGAFVAVELQTNREVAARLAGGRGWAPVSRTSALVSAALAGLLSVGLVALAPVLVPRVFGGSWLLWAGAALGVWGAAASYPLRGIYAGQRRYGWYGATMGLEGLVRIGAAVGLVWAGVDDGGWYGLVFGVGLAASAVATLPGPRHGAREPGPAQPFGPMAVGVALLAGASALTLVVANLGPVVLTSRLGVRDPAAVAMAASFVSLFVLARIPVLLVTPVQAMLLPRLTAAAERGELDLVRGLTRRVLLALLVAAVPGLLGWTLAGGWAAQVLFHAPLRLGWSVVAPLGVGTVAMVAAQLAQPALVALGRNRDATIAWALGTGVFAALLALPGFPVAGCVAAQVAGPLVVVTMMLRALRRGRAATGTGPSGPTQELPATDPTARADGRPATGAPPTPRG